MRTRTSWLAGLLLAGLLGTPSLSQAQGPNYGPPQFELPLPTMWGDRDTGPYVAGELLFMRINNPLRDQVLAFRGFWDEAGALRGETRPGNPQIALVNADAADRFINNFFVNQGIAGEFIGSKHVALTAKAGGSERFEPGFRLTIGYRFQDGIAIEGVYWRLADFRTSGGTSMMPNPGVGVRNDFADSFVSLPFFNYSPFFGGADRDVISNVVPVPLDNSGPPQRVGTTTTGPDIVFVDAADLTDLERFKGLPLPAFGIFNAAEDITVQFDQQIWNMEVNARFPVCTTDNTRTYALAGLRYLELSENFQLRVSDADVEGVIFPESVATYRNQWENRMYGVQTGMGNEAYLGGGFALSVEARVGVFANYQLTEVTLTRGDDNAVGVKSDRNAAGVSPMFQLGGYLWWYPMEGVQVRAGYEVLGVFAVHRSHNPVAFNVGQLDPEYKDVFLKLDGFNLGVAFIF